MMKKHYNLLSVVGITVFVAGCAPQANLYPQDNGVYKSVALTRSENAGTKAALKKARETCQKQDKHLKVIKQGSVYQGSNKELGNITSSIRQSAFMNAGISLPDTKSSNDYKSVVKFKCQ